MTGAANSGVLRIGNASGFYGDRFTAWREMLDGGGLDVLTGDYLAELTMLILGRDRLRDPGLGYARTFLRQMESCLGTAADRGVRIVTNAGGLNPAGLADALRSLADRLGVPIQVGHVEGDLLERPDALTANAYLGAFGIAACLSAGADIVVTGRVTDASLVVGPGIAHFGWAPTDLDPLAGATVAGHLIECGAQVTGGNFSFFTELPDGGRRPGFPIAELSADGSVVITKHPGTGGAVSTETVTAQLLYEIGGPDYLGPDVVTRLDSVTLTPDGPDRVRVSGARGAPAPDTLKVGVNTLGGFRNSMTFVLCGLDIEEKASLVRSQLTDSIGEDGLEFVLARTDHPDAADTEAASALLHVHLRGNDPDRAGRSFTAAAVELALASYPGCTLTTPPRDPVPHTHFTTEHLPQATVPHQAVLPTGRRLPIPPPPKIAVIRDQFPRVVGAPPPSLPDHPDLPAPRPSERGPAELGPAERGLGWGVGGVVTRRVPLGEVVGARSGDKGGDANLGVWARTEAGHGWLRAWLTVDRLRDLLPETAGLTVQRYELPNLRALNFVIQGLLGQGVAASTRFDPQAKALGELLRARIVDLPATLVGPAPTGHQHAPRPTGSAAESPAAPGTGLPGEFRPESPVQGHRRPVSPPWWAGLRSQDTPQRRQLRELTRQFARREVVPHLDGWERAGEVPRELHQTAGRLGLLGVGFPEEVGGSGGDLLDTLAVIEELIRAGGSSGLVAALCTHGIAVPHIVAAWREAADVHAPELVDRYVRPTLAGEKIGALAVTEPDGGSDVAGLRTTARRDGDDYVVNGTKTYITSGVRADFVTTAVRTGPAGAAGISLLVIDKDSPGCTVGRRLEKLGWHCSDTAELSFMDVRVPVANLVGAENTGFASIMRQFDTERLALATQAYATAARCLDLTLAWCRDRRTFGQPLSTRQVVRHRLAEMATRTTAAGGFVAQVAVRVASGEPLVSEVAMAKNMAVAACDLVVDQSVQLHGGYGYLRDAEVERHYRDGRLMGIGGGPTEIMNEIIAKGMGI